jgi:hypothetical protein
MIGDLLQQLTTTVVVAGLAIFALALGFFAIHYLNRRRQMLHQERMAALIKGLHYAGIARDVLVKPKPDSRDHMFSGLRWLFGAGAASGAMYGYESLQPVADAGAAMQGALIGIIPAAIGIAHMLFSWLCSRRASSGAASSGPYYRTVYRPAARRY